ncbi:transmembrane glucosamine N-acetyltransferase NagX [Thalassotalea atypica]|uniref:transmembrane glucosamine N-acetyltransferase NagX n=1 Tax=Thalassotalea atypica TaxID=2054316 RepID=UPI00257305D9|nr:DUF5009 domain-containing protein [Thalassotalea atypica]
MSQVMPEIAPETPTKPKRLLSVDALRGFDMFWIMGAEGLFAALFVITGWSCLELFDQQMKHSAWHGITAYDLIFPLFIFLSGVSIGIAAKPIKSYSPHQRTQQYKHAFKRLFLLLLLGVIYNHGWGTGVPPNPDEVRFASVLGRIGVAWFVAILLVWHLTIRQQWIVSISVLIGYWLLLSFVTIGDYGAGNYSATLSLNVWFDQHFLPGATYRNLPMDPEGLLSNIPSVINAMAGVFVGRYMKQMQQSANTLFMHLLIVGCCLLAIGFAWGMVFPINKSLWTSSFVLVTCGYSVLLLAVFYLLIDVLAWQFWAKFFAVIGMNSIVIYLSASLVNWKFSAHSLAGGWISALPQGWSSLLEICVILLLQWGVLYWLYRRNIFIKV